MSWPDWLTGPGITSLQVTPQVFSGGVLVTPAGPNVIVDFFGVIDDLEYEHTAELRSVTPSGSRQRHNVIVETGGAFTLTEIMRRTAPVLVFGQANNSLAALVHGYDHFKIRFVRASFGYTYYGVIGDFREHITQEKCTLRARFEPIGTVEAGVTPTQNPTYTSA